MYQIKVDKSNKAAVFAKKIGTEFSAPIWNQLYLVIINPFPSVG